MKSIFLTVGLLAIAAVSFAEETTEKKKELSETGVTVLEKLRELRKEQESLIAKIENETDRELITSVFKKELDTAETEVDATRVKRAAIKRRAANRRANRRRFARRLRRNQRRAAQKRRAHARRHQRNLRRAARKIRRIQRRG
ncbi:hypothetical protein TELCIR_00750 [Teladorsagia circumcincta]|uniref:Uncharacterized protein n=1 Tax=Teladorsagia circumcincta TaxID=45464 RepID=A0A2G9V3V4_TELCI|nr:hypothetical protein TELCIR_00750 [Teladorsagia circumcincta]